MPKTAKAAAPPASYEDALAELERLVAAMEGGQQKLDELLVGYRRGAELLGYCREQLERVEAQVKLVDDGPLRAWSPES